MMHSTTRYRRVAGHVPRGDDQPLRVAVNLRRRWLVLHDVRVVALDADFEAVFRTQFPRLVALGLAMTGNREVATDLAQETMARAHARWDEVSQMASPQGWVRQVMTNLLIDHHRRRKVEQGALERLAARPGSRESTSGTGGDGDLGELLTTLPPRQRAVVALYYLEDLPVSAIAETLGIATGTVKALLWKARASLANRLGLER